MPNPFNRRPKRRSSLRGRKGMSIRDLLKWGKDHEPDQANSHYVSIINVRPEDRSGRRTSAIQTSTITFDPKTTPPRRTHYQRIYPADEAYRGPLSQCPQVKFSCNCQRFLYYWEFALYKQSAADLYFGNGQPPRETNPHMYPALCKHGIVVLTNLRRHKL